jgi:hypothetical protein
MDEEALVEPYGEALRGDGLLLLWIGWSWVTSGMAEERLLLSAANSDGCDDPGGRPGIRPSVALERTYKSPSGAELVGVV